MGVGKLAERLKVIEQKQGLGLLFGRLQQHLLIVQVVKRRKKILGFGNVLDLGLHKGRRFDDESALIHRAANHRAVVMSHKVECVVLAQEDGMHLILFDFELLEFRIGQGRLAALDLGLIFAIDLLDVQEHRADIAIFSALAVLAIFGECQKPTAFHRGGGWGGRLLVRFRATPTKQTRQNAQAQQSVRHVQFLCKFSVFSERFNCWKDCISPSTAIGHSPQGLLPTAYSLRPKASFSSTLSALAEHKRAPF